MVLTIERLCYSETAEKNGIDNTPRSRVLPCLNDLQTYVLEPTHRHFGGELDITSGYRCQELNRLLGSSDNSQHCLGEAVDFGIADTDIFDIASWIKDNLDFDHLILEKYNPDDLNKGWIHCSYTCRYPNRKLIETFDGQEYSGGLNKLPLKD